MCVLAREREGESVKERESNRIKPILRRGEKKGTVHKRELMKEKKHETDNLQRT